MDISEQSYMWSGLWLGQGLKLLSEHAGFERDYPIPHFEYSSAPFKKKYASYADTSAYSCCLRRMLHPASSEGTHVPPDLFGSRTDHGERATLPTALSMLGVVKTWWASGSRMHQTVISNLIMDW